MRLPPKKSSGLEVRGTAVQKTGVSRPNTAATTTIRRSGSVSNLPQTHIAIEKQKEACHCSVENLQRMDLRDKYARSLEQQVQLLELENNFLSQAPTINVPTEQCNRILTRGHEVSLNGRDWCRLPSFHPSIEKVISDRIGKSEEKPSAIEKETSFEASTTQAPPTRDNTLRFSTMESGRSIRIPEVSLDRMGKPRSPDLELIQQLEEKSREIDLLIRQLEEMQRLVKHSDERIVQLTMRLKDAEADLTSRAEADTRDKRALVEESLELQRRLDDLTPTLAEKEARIVRVENEKEAIVSKLRTASHEVAELKLQLSELKRGDELQKEKEINLRSEVDRSREKLDVSQMEIERRLKKEEELFDEISSLRRQMKESELRLGNEKKLMEQIQSENRRLVAENSRLTTDFAKMEYDLGRFQEEIARSSQKTYPEEEVIELRLSIKSHQTKIEILEERLKAAQDRNEVLEKELTERWTSDEEKRSERSRVQKELDALQALSRSLSTENKTLREDKVDLTEKIASLKHKISSRDIQIRNLEDEMLQLGQKHEEELRRSEEGSRVNSQRALELEELSRRIRELSESIPTESRRSSASVRIIDTRRSAVDEGESTRQEQRRDSTRSIRHETRSRSIRTPIMEEPEMSCSFDVDQLIELARGDPSTKTTI